jgi:hypothetical protein
MLLIFIAIWLIVLPVNAADALVIPMKLVLSVFLLFGISQSLRRQRGNFYRDFDRTAGNSRTPSFNHPQHQPGRPPRLNARLVSLELVQSTTATKVVVLASNGTRKRPKHQNPAD